MDISCLIFAENTNESTARLGDFIDISKLSNSPCRHQRFALLHIEDIPNKAEYVVFLRRLKRTLTGRIEDRSNLSDVKLIRERQWFLAIPSLPNVAKTTLRDDKQLTTTWEQIRPYIKRRIAIDNDDESKDQFEVITEDDL